MNVSTRPDQQLDKLQESLRWLRRRTMRATLDAHRGRARRPDAEDVRRE
jgi:hypothetical protein